MSIDIESLPREAQKALQQFSEFQLKEFNDSGANGYVMSGRHDVLRKDVAIKIYFHDNNDVDQEPAIIATLNHENILKVFDARKVEEDCSFYMMQAANDGDLFSFQERYHLSLDLNYSQTTLLFIQDSKKTRNNSSTESINHSLRLRLTHAHICSIGFKSGLYAGSQRILCPCCSNNS